MKNNAIIGTAGHVDHGKTSLIKALTGIETDRLKEEKKRGITIELGFAHLDLPDGGRAGIVDVPGHEKFVRNMLAGAGSVDLCLLVIAADEGMMPQTREHLAILSVLGIERGIVVLNKADLVDPEWLEMVMIDISGELEGTFLENAEMMPVSAHTGQGINELRTRIFEMLKTSPEKNLDAPFRLPIDRIFTMEGFGTVVTGTLTEGTLNLGADVEIYPSGLKTKARRIQVHGAEVEKAVAGQRVALNLAGLKITDLERGQWAAAPNSMENAMRIDVVIEIDAGIKREIKNNSTLHLHHGTGDVLCNLILLDKASVKAGERAYGQLRLHEPRAVNLYDKFVLRFYSPTETVGGGMVLDPIAGRMKRLEPATLARFEAFEKGDLTAKIEAEFAAKSADFPKLKNIQNRYFAQESKFDETIKKLVNNQLLIDLADSVIHRNFAQKIGEKAQRILKKYHQENPLQKGMQPRELASQVLPRIAQNLTERAIDVAVQIGAIKNVDGLVALNEFSIQSSTEHTKVEERLLKAYLDAGFAPPDTKEVAEKFTASNKEKTAYTQVFAALQASGELVTVAPQITFHTTHYNRALEIFKQMAAENPQVITKDFRDKLDTSRKFAMGLLEHFDKKGISKMVGDGRILL